MPLEVDTGAGVIHSGGPRVRVPRHTAPPHAAGELQHVVSETILAVPVPVTLRALGWASVVIAAAALAHPARAVTAVCADFARTEPTTVGAQICGHRGLFIGGVAPQSIGAVGRVPCLLFRCDPKVLGLQPQWGRRRRWRQGRRRWHGWIWWGIWRGWLRISQSACSWILVG